MVTLSIVSKTDLGNGRHAVTVRPKLGHTDPVTGVAYGKEIVLVLPSSHKLCADEQYWRDTGARENNGNPIVVLDKRPKSLEELTDVDLLEIVADLTERLTAIELLVK